MLRLRRTAHKHSRRGACRSPCPRLRLAGSTPSGDCVPQCLRHRLPLLVWQRARLFWKRALAQAAQRQRTARSGGRFASESFDATATAQRAECLLRSTTRGPARSKVICARHAVGVASGHSLGFVRCRRCLRACFWRVSRVSGDLGYWTTT